MSRLSKAERLTRQILQILHEIGRIRSLTENQADRISQAVQAGAREMHLQIQVQGETPLQFTLQSLRTKETE